MSAQKYLYSVPTNGWRPPAKLYIVKETPRTYVVSPVVNNDMRLTSTIRKTQMSTNHERYYLDEESANKFYFELKNHPKEKSADEMLKQLGYKRDYLNEPKNVILYRDDVQDCKIFVSKYAVRKSIKECGTWEIMDFRPDEIKAIAKKIEETENEVKND